MSQVDSSLLGKKWRPRSTDTMASLKLQQDHGLSGLVADCLIGRGVSSEQVDLFLEPKIRDFLEDPGHLKDMDKAVSRTVKALENKEKIVVFGDYDVDGATSSALLSRFFRGIGIDVDVYIPDRLAEGYGPNTQAFQSFVQQGVSLVITVDCGTSAFAPLEEAKNKGLDVVVLDHHAGETKLPAATAVVNPNRLDEKSPYTYLAGVGVAFLFLVSLHRALREHVSFQKKTLPNLLTFLDLVALGTVCDVVPLKDLNRAFVSQGLKVLSGRENLGLRILMDFCGLQERPTAYHLGFLLGPRLNAGGRVGESSLGVELLTTKTPERAKIIAHKLESYNQERRELEEIALTEAHTQIEQKGLATQDAIVVGAPSWHPGVIGIVAGRLKDHYHRPTFVLSFDDHGAAKGSGRSVPGIDLGQIVQKAKHKGLLLAGGGHTMAAGLSLERSHLADFTSFLIEEVKAAGGPGTPELRYDGILSLKGVTRDLIEELTQLGPFGQGNPSPKFIAKDVRPLKASLVGQNHVRCYLSASLGGGSLEAIAFRALETPLGEALLKKSDRPLHIYGSLKLNEWNGGVKPQFIVEDATYADDCVEADVLQTAAVSVA